MNSSNLPIPETAAIGAPERAASESIWPGRHPGLTTNYNDEWVAFVARQSLENRGRPPSPEAERLPRVWNLPARR